MARRALGCLLLAIALVAPGASARAAVPTGPDGAAFYNPPAALVEGPPGTVIWARPATGLARLSDAGQTLLVLYRSRSAAGEPIAVSGTVAVPPGEPPEGGWPVVSWGHVTTGSADACAPSRATPASPALEMMLRGDALAAQLLRRGLAVARTDYEGLGTPGPHPYLIGAPLARSLTDIVGAARELGIGTGTRWAAAGHSEGGVAALFAARLAPALAPELELRAAAALAPPTRIRDLFQLFEPIPVASPLTADLTALAGLILGGAGVAEPKLAAAYADGGLSTEALDLMPHLEDRCYVELTREDSWGGLAPADIPGPRADEIKPALYRVLDENDPRHLTIRDVPVRIDQGLLDPVVPFLLAEELVLAYRGRGTDVTYQRHPTATHQTITSDGQAAGPAADWLTARLR